MKIEKNVPLPAGGRRSGDSMYPFPKMEVGDSFKIDERVIRRTRNAAYLFGSRRGWRFCCRKLDDNSYRIWRIK